MLLLIAPGNLQPEWESFAEWSEDLEVNIAKVDVTEQPVLDMALILDSCKDGEFRRYQGSRTKSDFINFISEQEWKSVEPISSWLGPSSFLSWCFWPIVFVPLKSKGHTSTFIRHLKKKSEELDGVNLDGGMDRGDPGYPVPPPNPVRQRGAKPASEAEQS
ncbi:hypothetical protein Chor_017083 [Crotalus horridus]